MGVSQQNEFARARGILDGRLLASIDELSRLSDRTRNEIDMLSVDDQRIDKLEVFADILAALTHSLGRASSSDPDILVFAIEALHVEYLTKTSTDKTLARPLKDLRAILHWAVPFSMKLCALMLTGERSVEQEKAEEDIESIRSLCNDLTAKREELEAELDLRDKKICGLEKKYTELGKRYEALGVRCREIEEARGKLTTSQGHLEANHDALTKKYEVIQQKIMSQESLQEDHRVLQSEHDELRTKYDGVTTEIVASREENADLRRRHGDLEREYLGIKETNEVSLVISRPRRFFILLFVIGCGVISLVVWVLSLIGFVSFP